MATRIVLLLAGITLASAPSHSVAQGPAPDQAMTLADAYRVAESNNPMLAAGLARTEAVRSMESSAALPPDPQLSVGVMNASLPGLSLDMSTSMAPAIEVMQMVPFPRKLSLSGEIARKQTEIAAGEAGETLWMVRARVAMAFYGVYQADRQIETIRGTLRLLEDFERVARAMYVSGEGRQADVLRAGVEVARMRAEIERMTAMREAAALRLNGVLNRPANTPVPAVAIAKLPDLIPSADTLRAWARDSRPLLLRSSLLVEQAGVRGDLARMELWPDLSVSFQYGQRDVAGMGTERMGSLMVGVSVPIFANRRQLKMRDEAIAMERMAEAELANVRVEVNTRIGELAAELDRAQTLMTLFRTEILPQAEAAVQSAFSSYRVGAVDFMTLLDARMMVNEYEQELYRLQAEYGQMIAELEMTIGREIPRNPDTAKEER